MENVFQNKRIHIQNRKKRFGLLYIISSDAYSMHL